MAIIPSTKYSGQTTTGDPGYPDGKAKNVTVSGDGTGTPLEADWVNDLWGFLQALLDRAGITASGSPDEVGTSDYLDSLSQWIGVEDDLYQRGYSVRTAELFQEDTFRVIADGWTNIKREHRSVHTEHPARRANRNRNGHAQRQRLRDDTGRALPEDRRQNAIHEWHER